MVVCGEVEKLRSWKYENTEDGTIKKVPDDYQLDLGESFYQFSRLKKKSKYEKYCLGRKCIHRRGCGRHLTKPNIVLVADLVNEQACMNSEPMPYKWLDRVKLSNGEPLPENK